jgi:hypothetical protein
MDLTDLYNFIKQNKWNDTEGSPVNPHLGMMFQSPIFAQQQMRENTPMDQFATDTGIDYSMSNDPAFRQQKMETNNPRYEVWRRKYRM